MREVDVILWLVEPTTFIGAGEQHIAEILGKVKTPVILAINKIDTVKSEEEIEACKKLTDRSAISPRSCRCRHCETKIRER